MASTLIVLTLLALLVTNHRITHMHNHLVEHLDRATHHLEGLINVSTQDTINAVVAQLGKAKDEILSKVADLNAQIEAAGVAEQVDTSELTAAAQALDDIVPDAVTDAPVE